MEVDLEVEVEVEVKLEVEAEVDLEVEEEVGDKVIKEVDLVLTELRNVIYFTRMKNFKTIELTYCASDAKLYVFQSVYSDLPIPWINPSYSWHFAMLAPQEDFLKKQLLASSLIVIGRWDCVHVQVFDPVM